MTDFTLPLEQALAAYRYKYLALYQVLRSKIRDGSLPEGIRLPATRELADMYGLSRGSVSQAYDMLLAEGYVHAKVGKGTFVAARFDGPITQKALEHERKAAMQSPQSPISEAKEREGTRGSLGSLKVDGSGTSGKDPLKAPFAYAQEQRSAQEGLLLSPWARRLQQLAGGSVGAGRLKQAGGAGEGFRQAGTHTEEREASRPSISFAGGLELPPAEFPHAAWRSALARASAEAYAGGTDVFGDAGLRAAIAAHLRASRGIAADPASICCFSGSMQAIALLSQLLLGEGARAVAEDPGYPGIRLAAAAAGAAVIPAEVDGRGLVPRDWDARVLFVTPGRQFPTGAVLAPERRRELLAWAGRRNAVIVEDDFDSEFRWAGRPMEPLMAQDPGERVVFVGSFTKTLFPALRLGYAVLPKPLVEPVRLAKALFEPSPPALLEQRTLARFMARGDYDKHLRRMGRIYGVRYEMFRRELEKRLDGLFEPLPQHSGLHVYARWLGSREAFTVFRAACGREGVFFRDVDTYWEVPHEPGACFFFAHLTQEEILEGLSRMEAAARKIWER